MIAPDPEEGAGEHEQTEVVAQAEDDRVQRPARLDPLAAGPLRRVELGEDAFDDTPEAVGHPPDGW